MKSWETIVVVALVLFGLMVLFFGLFLGGAVIVAVQAKWRGYSAWLWAAAGVVTLNPVIFLVMLALMPNRLRLQQRKQFQADLKRKLAARAVELPAHDAAPAGPAVERSLGDQPTIAPPERSLGDVETME
jgi:hypothetical protein